MTNLGSILESRDITLSTMVCLVKDTVYPVVMCECESWTKHEKTECQRIDAFKLWCWRRVLSPLNIKEIKPVIPKGNQPWIFIGRSEAEAESPILWPSDMKSWLIEKDPDIDKERGQEVKGATEDQMIRFHHWLSRHEFDQLQRLWRSGKPDMLQPMEWQRVGHDWVTEQQHSGSMTIFLPSQQCQQNHLFKGYETSWDTHSSSLISSLVSRSNWQFTGNEKIEEQVKHNPRMWSAKCNRWEILQDQWPRFFNKWSTKPEQKEPEQCYRYLAIALDSNCCCN